MDTATIAQRLAKAKADHIKYLAHLGDELLIRISYDGKIGFLYVEKTWENDCLFTSIHSPVYESVKDLTNLVNSRGFKEDYNDSVDLEVEDLARELLLPVLAAKHNNEPFREIIVFTKNGGFEQIELPFPECV